MTASRLTLQVFEQYQRARVTFVQTVSDLASRSNNIGCLQSAGALDLIKPLLTDPVPNIKQMAAIAMGRLANHSETTAVEILRGDVLKQLLYSIDVQNRYFKRSVLFILRAVSKHSAETAKTVVQLGGLHAMVMCLDDFDTGVKEEAAWALGYVARHDKVLAQAVVDSGAVPLLVLCLQEPDLCLKQIAASALGDIAKHSIELANSVVDAGCLCHLIRCLSNPDSKLKRQTLSALASISKYNEELTEAVVEGEIFPELIILLGHSDDLVKRNAAIVIREIAKQSLQLSQLVVNAGSIGGLIEMMTATRGDIRLPAIMTMGYISAHSDQLALAIIASKGLVQLTIVLNEEVEDHILAATIWAIGQMGKHSPEHANAVACANLFPKLIEIYSNDCSSEDLQQKARSTLKQILQKCLNMSALEEMLHSAPPPILKYIIGQFSKILPNDSQARRLFVSSGGLKKVQEIKAEVGTELMDYIIVINCCYPQEIVQYFSPGYSNIILDKVDQYTPEVPSLFAVLGERKESEEFEGNPDIASQ